MKERCGKVKEIYSIESFLIKNKDFVGEQMLEIKDKYQELLEKDEQVKKDTKKLSDEFRSISIRFEEQGNVFLSANCIKRAAQNLSELLPTDNEEIRMITKYFKEAGTKYHSIGDY